MVEKLLFSRAEVSNLLGISLRKVDSLLALKELPSRYIGRRRMVRRADLELFVTRGTSRSKRSNNGGKG
jgi:excisionase family DNA binding protein